jgi:hypothetical protein
MIGVVVGTDVANERVAGVPLVKRTVMTLVRG